MIRMCVLAVPTNYPQILLESPPPRKPNWLVHCDVSFCILFGGSSWLDFQAFGLLALISRTK